MLSQRTLGHLYGPAVQTISSVRRILGKMVVDLRVPLVAAVRAGENSIDANQ
jgi:hypothetical protein